MSRRCIPGKRARVITGRSNKGVIVLVVGSWSKGQEWGGSKDWEPCMFPWKTISLGRPLRICESGTGKPLPDSMYCVFEDEDLLPLDDDDDGLSRSTEKGKPKPVVKSKPKAVLVDDSSEA